MKAWNPKSSTGDPYGRPTEPGNGHELWRKVTDVPCSVCGATGKKLTVIKNEATIWCTSGHILAHQDL